LENQTSHPLRQLGGRFCHGGVQRVTGFDNVAQATPLQGWFRSLVDGPHMSGEPAPLFLSLCSQRSYQKKTDLAAAQGLPTLERRP